MVAEAGGCTFEENGSGSPFPMDKSFRLNKGIAFVGVVALGCCAAWRSRSNIRVTLAGLGRAEGVSVGSVTALDCAVVFESRREPDGHRFRSSLL